MLLIAFHSVFLLLLVCQRMSIFLRFQSALMIVTHFLSHQPVLKLVLCLLDNNKTSLIAQGMSKEQIELSKKIFAKLIFCLLFF